MSDHTDSREWDKKASKMICLGKLASTLAHDLNNVLAAMLGYTELASMSPSHGGPPQRYLQNVLSAGRRGKELIEQILIFQRDDLRTHQPIELKKILDDALVLLHPKIPSCITIHKVDHCGSSIILADSTQIYQVIINLLSNAVNAMKGKGGLLHIQIEECGEGNQAGTFSLSGESCPYFRLSIKDTGSGMTAEILNRVFDPFFTTHDHGEGTGLGLAIVKEIITSHSGSMTVESTLGEGSTFHVYLPKYLGSIHENTNSINQDIEA